MALAASRGGMSARKLKLRALVLRQCKCRRPEAIHGVARLAFVGVASVLKLAAVRVFMAIHAGAIGNFVAGIFAGRFVTLGALHRRVLSK